MTDEDSLAKALRILKESESATQIMNELSEIPPALSAITRTSSMEKLFWQETANQELMVRASQEIQKEAQRRRDYENAVIQLARGNLSGLGPPASAISETQSQPIKPKNKRRLQQLNFVLDEMKKRGWSFSTIPYGGKGKLRSFCCESAASLFTEDGFDHFWKWAAKKNKQP